MDISFYQVGGKTPAAVDGVLPVLLEKVLSKGHKIAICCASEERMERLDDVLWDYAPESFLPHGTVDEPNAENQPILLSTNTDSLNEADVLVLVGGVMPEDVTPYKRILDMFDSSDAQTQAARKRWKEWKSQDASLSYFAYENDKWVKKA